MPDCVERDPASALDALLGLVRVAVRGGYVPTAEISELAAALHQRAVAGERAISESGNGHGSREIIDDVREYGTPDEVGSAVGLSGRRVRQLAAAGLVAARPVGKNRWLVDLADVQRHLRGECA